MVVSLMHTISAYKLRIVKFVKNIHSPITFWCHLVGQWAALDVNHPHLSTFPQPRGESRVI